MRCRQCITLILLLIAATGALALTACDSAQSRKSTEGSSGLILYDTITARGHTSMGKGFAAAPATEAQHLRAAMPEGSLPGLDEEVWVIVKPEPGAATPAQQDSEIPGCGALMCRIPGDTQTAEPRDVPMPLKHTEVSTQISAYIASVEVVQQFTNPFNSKIEAVYVFPLPDNAAVNGFVMTIGERKIRGILREREEAEQIYQEAKSQGYVASLLTQERPNVFTQHVANIEPGRSVDVNIRYFHTLSYDDGWYEYVFPMVVGPRFNPPGFTDGIGAVPSAPMAQSGQKTDVHYLAPHERSGHDIDVTVSIDAAVPIEDITSRSHDIEINAEDSAQAQIRLASHDRIPNKDFVLRYRIGGEHVQAGMLTAKTDKGGYFTLMIYPPQDATDLARAPLEMVFVIDCSGSMSGKPLAIARKSVKRALSQLQPGDTFQVIRFSNEASRFGNAPIEASDNNIQLATRYVDGLKADGGTMMIEGVKAALDFPHDLERLRYVVFLTDGYIGNESDILAAVHERLGASHIFGFGIGSSTNRYLLNSMSKLGRGAVAYVGLRDDGDDIMDRFMQRMARPAMTDIEIDFGGMQVSDVVPQRLPALFVGRPVIVTGRFDAAQSMSDQPVRVRGTVAGRRVEAQLDAPVDSTYEHRALAAVWARATISEMMDRALYEPAGAADEWIGAIRQLALDYSLMSPFTAFIAVDSARVTEGESGTTVPVGVPVPEGVRYDTTVAKER